MVRLPQLNGCPIALAANNGLPGWRQEDSVSPVLAESPAKELPQGSTASLTAHHSYPKHVWSPAGGWYTQPANWRANTAVAVAVIFGITALTWRLSAEREVRYKMPEEGRFFPSR